MELDKKQWRLILVSVVGVCLAYHPISDTREPVVEKCYGIAKKGMNDCGNEVHTCAGLGINDKDPNDWVYVPSGTCNKIVGGKLN